MIDSLERIAESCKGKCWCGSELSVGDVMVCPSCDTPFHAECWNDINGCARYGCKERGKKLDELVAVSLSSDLNGSEEQLNWYQKIRNFFFGRNEETSFVTRYGSLAELVPQFVPGTCLTSAELTTERRTNNELRKQGFSTANFALYCFEKHKIILYFGGKENNPIFNNLEDACKQLNESGNYLPSLEEIELAKKNALKLEYDDLALHIILSDIPFVYFSINTKNHKSLNKTQRVFAEAVYGKADDFAQNMKMFANAGILSTNINVLNPFYLISNAMKNPIVRACWLNYFNTRSNFYADDHDVYVRYALRGVASTIGKKFSC